MLLHQWGPAALCCGVVHLWYGARDVEASGPAPQGHACWKDLSTPQEQVQGREEDCSRAGVKGNEQDAVFAGAPECEA